MTEKSKGTPAPEAGKEGEAKKKSRWTIDLEVGRFSVKFPSGNNASALMTWWGRLPEEFRPITAYGVQQRAADFAALGKEASASEKEAAIVDKLEQIAAGDFTAGPSLADICTAFVKLGAVKTPEEAAKRWKAKTPQEKEDLLESPDVKKALKAAFTARKAAQAEAAFLEAKPASIKF